MNRRTILTRGIAAATASGARTTIARADDSQPIDHGDDCEPDYDEDGELIFGCPVPGDEEPEALTQRQRRRSRKREHRQKGR